MIIERQKSLDKALLGFHHSFPTPNLSKISFSKKHNSKLDRACFPELY